MLCIGEIGKEWNPAKEMKCVKKLTKEDNIGGRKMYMTAGEEIIMEKCPVILYIITHIIIETIY